MDALITALSFLNLFAAAIAVGGWVLVLLAVVPTRARLPAGAAVAFHQASTERIDRFLPPAVAVSVVTALAVVILDRTLTSSGVILLIAGALAMGATASISIRVNMPMNRTIASWSPVTPPADADTVFQRWNRFHRLRTVAGLVALSCFIAGVLIG